MSVPLPPPPRPTPVTAPRRAPPAWRRPVLWLAAAFALGLLVSLLLLLRGREPTPFFRADSPAADGRVPAPLPAPMAGDGAEASGMDRSQPLPEVVEQTAPAPLPRTPATVAEPPAPPPEPVTNTPARPLPGATPAPRYPMSALRRGEGGEVLVRAEIGPDGVVTAVSLVQPSGNRALDRAALDAVRRWRFEPARRDGMPTVDSVQVPIRFNAD